MKKLLLATVAVSGLAMAAAPAHAEIELELGGYFKGYLASVNQDETAGTDVVGVDIIRDTKLFVGGETTLDNGLTVGAHIELNVDANDGNDTAYETYAYFSGNWGRVNFGAEDGSAYLLQVATPSADSNIDGIRQFVSPFVNTGNLTTSGANMDYAMDPTFKNDKLSYLSPIMNGFQVGLSFTPDSSGAATSFSVDTDTNASGTIQETYEIAARYEGQFQNVGVIAGAGYTLGSEEGNSTTTDDRQTWNVGLDLDIAAFGVGVSYSVDNNGLDGAANDDEDTLVIGADYTTGPFKIGASYFDRNNNGGVDSVDVQRYTGGVVYNYGPGMSFRGSVQYVDQNNTAPTTDANGTAFILGTQVNF